jgi:hypothetical protein
LNPLNVRPAFTSALDDQLQQQKKGAGGCASPTPLRSSKKVRKQACDIFENAKDQASPAR